mmetsp:Transcript_5342/g.33502  ORF Transcript_5342/g.33502 Transcript_5342/m.33502 type:complete len:282 (-) Transcript_5342:1397-2242(-)
MTKCPAYATLGKATKDLLLQDYTFFDRKQYDQKLVVETKTGSGMNATVNGYKKGEGVFGDVALAYKTNGVQLGAVLGSAPKIDVSVAVADVAPGLKCSVSGSVTDLQSGKLDLDWAATSFATLKASLGLATAPKADFNVAVAVADGLLVGAETGYDTAKGKITKYNVASQYSCADFTLSAFLLDKGDTVKVSYSHSFDMNRTIGGEIVRKISKADTTFTIGYMQRMEGGALAKIRLDNKGIATLGYKTEMKPNASLLLSSQFDTFNLEQHAKFGLALQMKA